MAVPLALGQILKGRAGTYKLMKTLQDSVWLAINHNNERVIIKSANHFRIPNERDVLLRFQTRTPYIRPLLDEVEQTSATAAIVLKYLDDDILQASDKKRLTCSEVRYVARRVLEALAVLHAEEFVHTVNYGKGETRFEDVQLADFGSTVREDSPYALQGDPIGTPIFRSPEAQLEMRWGTATDIWSFGAMLISLIYGEGFHIFKPPVPVGHDDYEAEIVLKYNRIFGPWPQSYEEIADDKRLAVLTWSMENSPAETLKPFRLTTAREICAEDKEFVLKLMKLDPRDRPTARQLLEDPWFS